MIFGFIGKKCPKCSGNLYYDRDYYRDGSLITWLEQESCLQCGYINYQSESPQTEIAVTTIVSQRELLPV